MKFLVLWRNLKMKCPYCKEWIRKGAVLCKHCHSAIDGNGNAVSSGNEEGIKYLQNGFNKIYAECDTIENRIKERTGFVFIKHQYSSDELIEATIRIDSFIEKMKSDIEEWEAANKLAQQVRQVFNKKAGEAYQRLESLHRMIESREPTWWEVVCDVFQRILEKLFSFFSVKLIAGKPRQKSIAA
jgi:hypothetical protein